MVPGQVPAGGVPAPGARPTGPGATPRIQSGNVVTVEKERQDPDAADLDKLRTDPAINERVMRAGGGSSAEALHNDPTLRTEVEAARRAGKFQQKAEEKGLESDVIVKRWLAAAKTARAAASDMYGPVTDPATGQAITNLETGQPYTFEDVLSDSPFWSRMGEVFNLGPGQRLRYLSKDSSQPLGLRLAARRVLEGPTIRPKLAKSSGEVGNLNTMEQTVFDSMIVGENDTKVEGRDKANRLFKILDTQIALLEAGKTSPLEAANRFRQALGLQPRDHLATVQELAAEDKQNALRGFVAPPETPPSDTENQ